MSLAILYSAYQENIVNDAAPHRAVWLHVSYQTVHLVQLTASGTNGHIFSLNYSSLACFFGVIVFYGFAM